MSTRSSARNIFPPLDNPELTIQRRSRSDPTLLNISEMAAEGNGDLPVPDLQTMEELCQASLNGQGGPIASIAIQATNFGLKNDMIQQVQNSFQFHGQPGDAANKHLDKFLHVTQSIKVNGVTDDALHLYLFPHSLTHHATAWFDRLLRNSINTFEQMAKMFLGGTLCYNLTENMTAHHNDWDTSAQRSESSSSINSSSDIEIVALKAEMAEINKNLMIVLQVNQQVKAVTLNCETCGGPHSFSDFPATVGNTQYVYAAGAYQGIKETIILKGTTREETNSSKELIKIPQPQIATTNELTNYMKANDAILKNMQTNMTSLTNSNLELKNMFGQFMKMNTASSSSSGTLLGNTITNPKEDLKGITTRRGTTYLGPTIPTSSPVVERETVVTKDTVHPANNVSTEDVQPLVVPTESPILTSEPDNSLIIEPVVSLVSAPRPNQRHSIPYPSRMQDQKLRDKANDQREKVFQIFKDLNCNISFADALILMPKFGPSIKSLLTNKDKLCELTRTPLNEHCSANKLYLPDLFPTCMTLELADRSISHPVGVAEDVFVKVGTFHLPADFVVVDFDANHRVPLVIERSFLKTGRALIDVFKGELTLCVGKEAITFNLNQTSRYSANYNDMMANRIDVINMACEEYSQEVLVFSDVITSSNPTPYYDLIVPTTSLTLTPFENSDFLLEEGGILLLEAFLNDDPSLPLPNQRNYLPEVCKELKIYEAKSDKSSIDEPLEVELKDLPPHLEYAFLEVDDKLPVIIAKDLSMEEKTTLIPVLKSHKQTIAWKLSDIKEVLKLLDAGLIYTISDSPWVSPIHCVPKKGGFTVVENEENELISTRLVTSWRVCIDYRMLNEATRKDHFPLPFMDQMLERLAGNQYYCFLDGFSGCMMAIFHDMIKKTMEVFMDDFSVFGNSFQSCLSHLKKMLKMREDTNLCLNWEKSHFMVKEGIVLGHKIFKEGIEVDKAKVDVITKLPHLTTVKGIRSFLCHASFYRRFIKDFSKIAMLMNHLLEKDTPFLFSKECVEAFQTLKRKLTTALIMIAPDWDMPFELMCDASDFAIGAVLGQRQEKYFRPIHY
nr:reverse transcriptase domain-containing protein [Tanacetum cinerariifolium]